ncbi:MAG TPA: ribosome-associated translation inhibitor RaiA [Mollicutes bacterium]|jgi:ribosomal subunit interface protein|nr:ribosome-associated translation inhibitor RaiA [Mollicutes bacterium]
MKFEIRGDKLLITEAIKNYVEEKLSRLDKYLEKPDEITAKITLKARGNKQKIEVTIPINSLTLRNEEEHNDLYAAIDIVVDKLERQVIKSKTKIQSKALKLKNVGFNFENVEDEKEETKKIVRRKKLDMKPMSEEEAILQMNMLNHDFFIFQDSETDYINVLYKRKDGNYGIIETK